MEVEVLEQFLLDAGAHAIAEQCAVGDNDGSAGWKHLALNPSPHSGEGMFAQFPHDELQEEQRRFGGLFVFGEIALDAPSVCKSLLEVK